MSHTDRPAFTATAARKAWTTCCLKRIDELFHSDWLSGAVEHFWDGVHLAITRAGKVTALKFRNVRGCTARKTP